jgi:hypothetical protein
MNRELSMGSLELCLELPWNCWNWELEIFRIESLELQGKVKVGRIYYSDFRDKGNVGEGQETGTTIMSRSFLHSRGGGIEGMAEDFLNPALDHINDLTQGEKAAAQSASKGAIEIAAIATAQFLVKHDLQLSTVMKFGAMLVGLQKEDGQVHIGISLSALRQAQYSPAPLAIETEVYRQAEQSPEHQSQISDLKPAFDSNVAAIKVLREAVLDQKLAETSWQKLRSARRVRAAKRAFAKALPDPKTLAAMVDKSHFMGFLHRISKHGTSLASLSTDLDPMYLYSFFGFAGAYQLLRELGIAQE